MGQRDMLLELSVVSYHRLSPKQVAVKRFDASGGSLGRSEHADWCLPDPERVVSGVHALINLKNGQFSITDESTNGLFVNRSVDALGQGNSHLLQNGDTLCLGDYEIQVALIESSAENNLTQQPSSVVSTASAFATPSNAGLRIEDVAPVKIASNTIKQEPAYNSQHELTLDEHFLAPAALIPDDWGSGWLSNETAESAITSSVQPPATKTNNLVKPAKESDPQAYLQAFLTGLGISESNQQAMYSVQWWEQLGQALQQSLQGAIAVMRERSNVKSTFRVNQTTFQQRENNPLKFSANIDEAFHNLFNRPGSSFMPASQAIAEAFADISQHESAIIAGASGAMVGLLEQLAPQRIEEADFGGGFIDKVNPAQRQARLWARYKALHNELSKELNNTNKQGINDDFINAYETYLRRK